MVGGVPERRLRAVQRAFPRLAATEAPDLFFLAVLHTSAIELVDESDELFTDDDRQALMELIVDDVELWLARLLDLKHQDVASWLETYWLPIAPTEELRAVRTWGPAMYEPLPDHRELPVTSAAQYWVYALFNRRTDFDEYLDHECHVEMRRLAAEDLHRRRPTRVEPEEVWEYRTRGPGWHHGSE